MMLLQAEPWQLHEQLSLRPTCGNTNLGALHPCMAVLPAGRALLVMRQCLSVLHALPQIV